MYRAFYLNNVDWSKVSRETGDAIYKRDSDVAKKSLESFLSNGILDGTKLSAHWFPKTKADVFISHSHEDEDSAIRCAAWLKDELGLNSFVDSCVWGHADDLLKEIDDKHCLNPGGETYSYPKRNRSTSHVHMMLGAALSAMLDTTECVIFLKTLSSITSSDVVSKTKSPWLSFELATMHSLRRTVPERLSSRVIQENFSGTIKKATALRVEYVVPLDRLTCLGADELNGLAKASEIESAKGHDALDILYARHPER